VKQIVIFILISQKNSVSIMIFGNEIVNSDWNHEKDSEFPKLWLFIVIMWKG